MKNCDNCIAISHTVITFNPNDTLIPRFKIAMKVSVKAVIKTIFEASSKIFKTFLSFNVKIHISKYFIVFLKSCSGRQDTKAIYNIARAIHSVDQESHVAGGLP